MPKRKLTGGNKSMLTLENFLILVIVVLLCVTAYQMYNKYNAESFENNDKLTPKGNYKYNFVMFYADWCPHCQNAKPYFKRLKAQRRNTNCKVTLLDAEQNQELSKKYEIEGYPTFKLIKSNGSVVDFDESVDENGFNSFLDKNTK